MENKDQLAMLDDLRKKLWQSLNMIRGSLAVDDYDIILYLLLLERHNVFYSFEFSSLYDVKESLRTAIKDYDGENAELLQRLFSENYEAKLAEIDDKAIFDLNHLFNSIDQSLLHSHFAELFEVALTSVIKMHGRFGEQSMLQTDLCRIALHLVDLPQNCQVYNPFAGFASFGALLPINSTYIGQEINQKAWTIGLMRLIANNKNRDSVFLNENSIAKWGMKIPPVDYSADDEKKHSIDDHDLVIAAPPLGLRLQHSEEGKFGAIRDCEHFLVEKGIEILKSNGKLIAVLSNGFLSRSGSEKNLRQYLIENDLLETIIALPGGLLMNTGIPVSIIVINKCKKKKDFVRFIDARSFVRSLQSRDKIIDRDSIIRIILDEKESDFSKFVHNQTILGNDNNLNVPRYFLKQYEGVKLADILSIIRGHRIGENPKGKFIRIRDLKEDDINFSLNLDKIEISVIPRSLQRIEESCLLLAGRWKTLKPTLFNYIQTPIYVNTDTFAFKINEDKCDIAYLVNELHSDYVNAQLDSYREGSVIAMIRKEDLLSIKINLPSLDEQKILVKNRLQRLAEEKKKELALFNKIHGLETELQEQNSYLRHTLAGPSSNLKDSVSNLKKILLEQVVPNYPGLLGLKVSDSHLVSLGSYLEIIERDATKIVSTVKSQLKVETGIDKKDLHPVEILSFLEKYTSEYNDREELIFKIKFDIDKEAFNNDHGNYIKTFINANDDLLRDLFDNLIDNALKHAFETDGNNRIEIFIMKDTEDEGNDEIQILVSNTGKAFPQGFTFSDFVRKGSKSGLNAGDGYGGWYINEIIKRFNGGLDIIDETGPEGLPNTDLATSFEITLPIIEVEENV